MALFQMARYLMYQRESESESRQNNIVRLEKIIKSFKVRKCILKLLDES